MPDDDLLAFIQNAVNEFSDTEAIIRKATQEFAAKNQNAIPDGDWRQWVKTVFPDYASGEFGDFHEEFWKQAWSIELGATSDPLVFCVFRGGAKSMTGQLAAVSLGARNKRRYVWYVSRTQDQADSHVGTIGNSLLAESTIEKHYPDIASRAVTKYGSAEGWRRNRFITKSGFAVDALGIDTAARGVKLGEQRPDLIIFDDIDKKHDSPAATAKLAEIMTTSIIASGAQNCVIWFLQNLIAKDSIASQLIDGRASFMAGRKVIGPIPAMRGFAYEKEAGGRYKITSGAPSWGWYDLKACENQLNNLGPDAFLRECQHEVEIAITGAIFPSFDERIHVITDTEFINGLAEEGISVRRSASGRAIMPDRWTIGRAQDVGTTMAHPNATAWVAKPFEEPFTDCIFAHRELLFPDWQAVGDVIEPVSLRQIATEIHRLERLGEEGHRVRLSLISHEASSEVNTYNIDLPVSLKLSFSKWEPDRRRMEGVAQLQNYLEVNESKPHPFRRYPDGHPQAGEPLEGRPRFYFIVADGQGELINHPDGRLRVAPAVDDDGLVRARWEMPKYRLPMKATGEESDVPVKIDDDYIDALKSLARQFFPRPDRKTPAEVLEDSLPDFARYATLKARIEVGEPIDYNAFAMNRLIETRVARSRPQNGGALIDRFMRVGGDE